MLTPGATISVLTPAATDGGGRGSSLVMIVNRPCMLGGAAVVFFVWVGLMARPKKSIEHRLFILM